ncbi:MAG TPA: thioredoxin [Kiloniellales bacterium]|nr:thioredoxin [Kiloniellales bacterium]
METLIGGGQAGPDGGQPPADVIKDSNEQHFAQDVIQASMQAPVIVDFWAPWCGPCKQLGPALEKAVKAGRGAVKLVKINVDENQMLAAQLRIQSIPTVYAFYQGQPVDGFMGAQSETEVKRFVDRLLRQAGAEPGPSPVDQALEQAQAALDQGQHGPASALFGQVLQHDPENETALAGLIRCHLASGDLAEARRMYDSVTEPLRSRPALSSVAAALELAEQNADTGAIPELEAKVQADPNDHQARFDLALALHAAGQREAAADALLEIVRRDKNWNEGAAREQLVKFFEAWGPNDPLTLSARRRLSSVLFA